MTNPHTIHFAQFKAVVERSPNKEPDGSRIPLAYAKGLKWIQRDKLPKTQSKRADLFALAADSAIDTATVCLCVAAWGGMRKTNRNHLFNKKDRQWVEVAEKIRGGKVNRSTAFAEFSALRKDGGLKGMGPAYFTKIIYFLMPRSKSSKPIGYILDQWAGSSINYLWRLPIVRLDTTFRWAFKNDGLALTPSSVVSDANTQTEYEDFCQRVEYLSNELKLKPEQIDLGFMSRGSANQSGWRELILNYQRNQYLKHPA
jgi:hypothetical protein